MSQHDEGIELYDKALAIKFSDTSSKLKEGIWISNISRIMQLISKITNKIFSYNQYLYLIFK